MTATSLIKEINKLPVEKKILIVEKTLKSIKQEKDKKILKGVEHLLNEYKTNPDLTSFTVLDPEGFYETR